MQDDRPQPPPSFWLFVTEGFRALGDVIRFFVARSTLLKTIPPGNGGTVLVLPGFLAGDASTYLLRSFLRSLGYRTERWRLGINLGLKPGMQDRLAARLSELAAQHGKITIVGQSLGGVFARELAKRQPETVRRIITLGSPISADPRSTNARVIYRLATGERPADLIAAMRKLSEPPPVPCTALFSRWDGIVSWLASREETGGSRENVELHCSHVGMSVDPGALVVIGDRLAQQDNQWMSFTTPNWAQKYFPATIEHD